MPLGEAPIPDFPREFLESYPSQGQPGAGPPEPLLLDTSVVQHLDWVWKRLDENIEWTDDTVKALESRFGPALVDELFALGHLVIRFEWDGFPWIVSASSEAEIKRARRANRTDLAGGWEYFAGHQEDWGLDAWGSIAPGMLSPSTFFPDSRFRVSPLLLRSLGVATVEEIVDVDGPLRAFRDAGDRAVIREAIVSGAPGVLTTDLRSFWAHRDDTLQWGVEIWRPSDLLLAYDLWTEPVEARGSDRSSASSIGPTDGDGNAASHPTS